jgi:hypothetical protein
MGVRDPILQYSNIPFCARALASEIFLSSLHQVFYAKLLAH